MTPGFSRYPSATALGIDVVRSSREALVDSELVDLDPIAEEARKLIRARVAAKAEHICEAARASRVDGLLGDRRKTRHDNRNEGLPRFDACKQAVLAVKQSAILCELYRFPVEVPTTSRHVIDEFLEIHRLDESVMRVAFEECFRHFGGNDLCVVRIHSSRRKKRLQNILFAHFSPHPILVPLGGSIPSRGSPPRRTCSPRSSRISRFGQRPRAAASPRRRRTGTASVRTFQFLPLAPCAPRFLSGRAHTHKTYDARLRRDSAASLGHFAGLGNAGSSLERFQPVGSTSPSRNS